MARLQNQMFLHCAVRHCDWVPHLKRYYLTVTAGAYFWLLMRAIGHIKVVSNDMKEEDSRGGGFAEIAWRKTYKTGGDEINGFYFLPSFMKLILYRTMKTRQPLENPFNIQKRVVLMVRCTHKPLHHDTDSWREKLLVEIVWKRCSSLSSECIVKTLEHTRRHLLQGWMMTQKW